MEVNFDDIVILPPFRPKITNFVPKNVSLLMHALDVDHKTGTVTSGAGMIRQALNIYFQDTWSALI